MGLHDPLLRCAVGRHHRRGMGAGKVSMSAPMLPCPQCGTPAPVDNYGQRSIHGPFIRARKCPSCGYEFRTTDESGAERAITPLCGHGGIVGLCGLCKQTEKESQ